MIQGEVKKVNQFREDLKTEIRTQKKLEREYQVTRLDLGE